MSLDNPELRPDLAERRGESGVLDVIDVLRDNKWLIATITCLGVAAAAAYIVAVPPAYEASALIQVEESRPPTPTSPSVYADAANLFDTRSPAVAEISILRSGLVLGEVVSQLGLDVSARPKYVPFVGEWLARKATGPSQPGLFGLPGYVHGNESIHVSRFIVPRDYEGQPFQVALTPSGYDLSDPTGQVVLKGTTGKAQRFATAVGPGEIVVDDATGRPGAEFRVERISRSAAIDRLQRALKVEEQGRQSGILRLRLAGNDPEQVARIVNEVGKTYVRQNVERRTAEADKALVFVGSMIPGLRKQIEQAEGKLTSVRNKNATAFDISASGKLALEQSLQLQNRLLELQNKRRELATNYLDDHPSMKAIDAQISSISAELGSVNKRIKTLPAMEQETVGLSRELKVNSDLYVSLLTSAQQVRLAREGQSSNVRVVDAAWPAYEPVGPLPPALLVAGTTGGLVTGVLLALLRHGLRRGVQDPDRIETGTAMSVLSTVPYSKMQRALARTRGSKVLAIRAPQDPAVESLRSMRTALQRSLPQARSNIILITGPTHGIGKSFTSVNLAAVLGATGRRVLLIDADMRKGQLNDSFGLKASPGLSNILSAECRVGDAMHRAVIPNVDFIAAGNLSQTPSDLLTTRGVEKLLNAASGEYDYIVLDTPPVLAASDAAILAQWAGAVFMIARAEVTSLRELHESEKRLSQRGAQVDGVIYTGVDISKRRNDIYTYGGYDYLAT